MNENKIDRNETRPSLPLSQMSSPDAPKMNLISNCNGTVNEEKCDSSMVERNESRPPSSLSRMSSPDAPKKSLILNSGTVMVEPNEAQDDIISIGDSEQAQSDESDTDIDFSLDTKVCTNHLNFMLIWTESSCFVYSA